MDYDRRTNFQDTWGNSFPVVEFNILGSTTIYKGDLLFYDQVNKLRDHGSSTASWTVFPFSKLSGSTGTLESNKELAKNNFAGVAAWHSDSGVTESIAVYIDGCFNYPLRGVRHTKVGYKVTPTGSGTTLSDQIVAVESASTKHIGIVCDSGDFRSSIDMRIMTFFTTKLEY